MSFHYLLDGFNVLYALQDIPSGNWEAKREALLELIARFRPHGKNLMTVVFDSREGSGSHSKKGDIQVVFTAGETADDWISHRVRTAGNPRLYIVVTNDQGLCRMIRGTGARSIATDEFWKKAKTPATPRVEPRTDWQSEAITDEFKKKWL